MKIRVLPKDIASRIAAGEVIECPASVVKELVENSIDAESKRIDLTFIQGGKTRIVVEDNGSGMDQGDMNIAITRHSTSKISSLEDLHNIHTLGFRGEALASIAAVSRLDIRSRVLPDNKGYLIQVEDGKIISSNPVSCNPGTRVQVDDLFFNLPARRKFLRSSLGEFRRINQLLRSFSISYPEIDFLIKNDGRSVLSTLGRNDRKAVLELLWGKETEITLNRFKNGPVSVELWLQKQPGKKKVRMQNFVNGRVVQDPMIKAAVLSSLGEIAANVAVILSVPADHVDVNIHPAKTEVRFRYSREVFEAVRSACHEQVSLNPVTIFPASSTFLQERQISPDVSGSGISERTLPFPDRNTGNLFSRVSCGVSDLLEKTGHSSEKGSDTRFLGQLEMGYLLFETSGSLFIMDHHAAHERVVFEKIRSRSLHERAVFPLAIDIEIPADLQEEVRSYRVELENNSFKFSEEQGLIFLKAIPQSIADLDGSPFEYLSTLLRIWDEGSTAVIDAAVWMKWSSMACKASVKLTTRLTDREALILWDDLMNSDNPYACPHGRPTLLEMNRNHLVRYFGR